MGGYIYIYIYKCTNKFCSAKSCFTSISWYKIKYEKAKLLSIFFFAMNINVMFYWNCCNKKYLRSLVSSRIHNRYRYKDKGIGIYARIKQQNVHLTYSHNHNRRKTNTIIIQSFLSIYIERYNHIISYVLPTIYRQLMRLKPKMNERWEKKSCIFSMCNVVNSALLAIFLCVFFTG